jgi:hypothetical protein
MQSKWNAVPYSASANMLGLKTVLFYKITATEATGENERARGLASDSFIFRLRKSGVLSNATKLLSLSASPGRKSKLVVVIS